ncbi:oxidoreductase [Brevibacillus laterosporus]|nr:oxidoreductase [Brevibacillus laterosporus]
MDRDPRLKPETLEKYAQCAERLIAIQDGLGRELTDSEKRTLAWLFSNIHHIFFINIVILYKIHNSPQSGQNNVEYTENIIY